MNSRRISALLALPAAALAVAACSSSTSGIGQLTGGTGGSTQSGSDTVKSPGDGGNHPTTAAGLGGLMQSALPSITSLQFKLTAGAAGINVTGSGAEQLESGKLKAMDIKESVPQAGDVEILVAGGKTYAKLPASENSSGMPWTLVTTSSSNPVIQQMAASLDQTLSSASVSSYSDFIKAAKSVHYEGQDTVEGTDTSHYTVVVDVTKLPASVENKQALAETGITELPLELYVDSQGRPWKVTEDFTVQGQHVTVDFSVTDYNTPVTITPPPADQVSTD